MIRRTICTTLAKFTLPSVAGLSLLIPSLIPMLIPMLIAPDLIAQKAQPASRLLLGPTYTSSDGKGLPKFPDLDLVYSLTGPDGKPVPAQPADLKLFSQGREIATASAIRRFEQTGYGVTSILALDASGSMKGAPLNAIHASISKFVGQARSQDKVAVLTFADDTEVSVPFNHSQTDLAKELETVQARGTKTRLWDGLLFALDQFNERYPQRRQLIVISDGHDEGSQHSAADVIAKANAAGVGIDAIGLTRDRGDFLKYLQQVSNSTGGSYRRALSAQDLDGLIQNGLAAIKATPVASFRLSALATDGTRQPIELRWLPGKLTASSFLTPPRAIKPAPRRTTVDNLWIWGLALCFVAGLVLLFASWRSARHKPGHPPASQPGSEPPAAINPPSLPVGDEFPQSLQPTESVQSFRTPIAVPRTPTLDESEPLPLPPQPRPQPPPAPPLVPPRVETYPEQAPLRSKVRSVTQLAGYFEAPENGPYARLQINSGELAGEVVPVTAASFTIGALESNDLVIQGDPTISGRHARLIWEAGILKIEDTKSTNGTYVNSQRIEPGRNLLRPGDEIRIGKAVLLVQRA